MSMKLTVLLLRNAPLSLFAASVVVGAFLVDNLRAADNAAPEH